MSSSLAPRGPSGHPSLHDSSLLQHRDSQYSVTQPAEHTAAHGHPHMLPLHPRPSQPPHLLHIGGLTGFNSSAPGGNRLSSIPTSSPPVITGNSTWSLESVVPQCHSDPLTSSLTPLLHDEPFERIPQELESSPASRTTHKPTAPTPALQYTAPLKITNQEENQDKELGVLVLDDDTKLDRPSGESIRYSHLRLVVAGGSDPPPSLATTHPEQANQEILEHTKSRETRVAPAAYPTGVAQAAPPTARIPSTETIAGQGPESRIPAPTVFKNQNLDLTQEESRESGAAQTPPTSRISDNEITTEFSPQSQDEGPQFAQTRRDHSQLLENGSFQRVTIFDHSHFQAIPFEQADSANDTQWFEEHYEKHALNMEQHARSTIFDWDHYIKWKQTRELQERNQPPESADARNARVCSRLQKESTLCRNRNARAASTGTLETTPAVIFPFQFQWSRGTTCYSPQGQRVDEQRQLLQWIREQTSPAFEGGLATLVGMPSNTSASVPSPPLDPETMGERQSIQQFEGRALEVSQGGCAAVLLQTRLAVMISQLSHHQDAEQLVKRYDNTQAQSHMEIICDALLHGSLSQFQMMLQSYYLCLILLKLQAAIPPSVVCCMAIAFNVSFRMTCRGEEKCSYQCSQSYDSEMITIFEEPGREFSHCVLLTTSLQPVRPVLAGLAVWLHRKHWVEAFPGTSPEGSTSPARKQQCQCGEHTDYRCEQTGYEQYCKDCSHAQTTSPSPDTNTPASTTRGCHCNSCPGCCERRVESLERLHHSSTALASLEKLQSLGTAQLCGQSATPFGAPHISATKHYKVFQTQCALDFKNLETLEIQNKRLGIEEEVQFPGEMMPATTPYIRTSTDHFPIRETNCPPCPDPFWDEVLLPPPIWCTTLEKVRRQVTQALGQGHVMSPCGMDGLTVSPDTEHLLLLNAVQTLPDYVQNDIGSIATHLGSLGTDLSPCTQLTALRSALLAGIITHPAVQKHLQQAGSTGLVLAVDDAHIKQLGHQETTRVPRFGAYIPLHKRPPNDPRSSRWTPRTYVAPIASRGQQFESATNDAVVAYSATNVRDQRPVALWKLSEVPDTAYAVYHGAELFAIAYDIQITPENVKALDHMFKGITLMSNSENLNAWNITSPVAYSEPGLAQVLWAAKALQFGEARVGPWNCPATPQLPQPARSAATTVIISTSSSQGSSRSSSPSIGPLPDHILRPESSVALASPPRSIAQELEDSTIAATVTESLRIAEVTAAAEAEMTATLEESLREAQREEQQPRTGDLKAALSASEDLQKEVTMRRERYIKQATEVLGHSLLFKPITADGNCGPRAISYMRYSTESRHDEVRIEIADLMLKNARNTSCERGMQEAVAHRMTGYHVSNEMFQCEADAGGIPIVLVNMAEWARNSEYQHTTFHPLGVNQSAQPPLVWTLVFDGQNHFDATERVTPDNPAFDDTPAASLVQLKELPNPSHPEAGEPPDTNREKTHKSDTDTKQNRLNETDEQPPRDNGACNSAIMPDTNQSLTDRCQTNLTEDTGRGHNPRMPIILSSDEEDDTPFSSFLDTPPGPEQLEGLSNNSKILQLQVYNSKLTQELADCKGRFQMKLEQKDAVHTQAITLLQEALDTTKVKYQRRKEQAAQHTAVFNQHRVQQQETSKDLLGQIAKWSHLWNEHSDFKAHALLAQTQISEERDELRRLVETQAQKIRLADIQEQSVKQMKEQLETLTSIQNGQEPGLVAALRERDQAQEALTTIQERYEINSPPMSTTSGESDGGREATFREKYRLADNERNQLRQQIAGVTLQLVDLQEVIQEMEFPTSLRQRFPLLSHDLPKEAENTWTTLVDGLLDQLAQAKQTIVQHELQGNDLTLLEDDAWGQDLCEHHRQGYAQRRKGNRNTASPCLWRADEPATLVASVMEALVAIKNLEQLEFEGRTPSSEQGSDTLDEFDPSTTSWEPMIDRVLSLQDQLEQQQRLRECMTAGNKQQPKRPAKTSRGTQLRKEQHKLAEQQVREMWDVQNKLWGHDPRHSQQVFRHYVETACPTAQAAACEWQKQALQCLDEWEELDSRRTLVYTRFLWAAVRQEPSTDTKKIHEQLAKTQQRADRAEATLMEMRQQETQLKETIEQHATHDCGARLAGLNNTTIPLAGLSNTTVQRQQEKIASLQSRVLALEDDCGSFEFSVVRATADNARLQQQQKAMTEAHEAQLNILQAQIAQAYTQCAACPLKDAKLLEFQRTVITLKEFHPFGDCVECSAKKDLLKASESELTAAMRIIRDLEKALGKLTQEEKVTTALQKQLEEDVKQMQAQQSHQAAEDRATSSQQLSEAQTCIRLLTQENKRLTSETPRAANNTVPKDRSSTNPGKGGRGLRNGDRSASELGERPAPPSRSPRRTQQGRVMQPPDPVENHWIVSSHQEDPQTTPEYYLIAWIAGSDVNGVTVAVHWEDNHGVNSVRWFVSEYETLWYMNTLEAAKITGFRVKDLENFIDTMPDILPNLQEVDYMTLLEDDSEEDYDSDPCAEADCRVCEHLDKCVEVTVHHQQELGEVIAGGKGVLHIQLHDFAPEDAVITIQGIKYQEAPFAHRVLLKRIDDVRIFRGEGEGSSDFDSDPDAADRKEEHPPRFYDQYSLPELSAHARQERSFRPGDRNGRSPHAAPGDTPASSRNPDGNRRRQQSRERDPRDAEPDKPFRPPRRDTPRRGSSRDSPGRHSRRDRERNAPFDAAPPEPTWTPPPAPPPPVTPHNMSPNPSGMSRQSAKSTLESQVGADPRELAIIQKWMTECSKQRINLSAESSSADFQSDQKTQSKVLQLYQWISAALAGSGRAMSPSAKAHGVFKILSMNREAVRLSRACFRINNRQEAVGIADKWFQVDIFVWLDAVFESITGINYAYRGREEQLRDFGLREDWRLGFSIHRIGEFIDCIRDEPLKPTWHENKTHVRRLVDATGFGDTVWPLMKDRAEMVFLKHRNNEVAYWEAITALLVDYLEGNTGLFTSWKQQQIEHQNGSGKNIDWLSQPLGDLQWSGNPLSPIRLPARQPSKFQAQVGRSRRVQYPHPSNDGRINVQRQVDYASLEVAERSAWDPCEWHIQSILDNKRNDLPREELVERMHPTCACLNANNPLAACTLLEGGLDAIRAREQMPRGEEKEALWKRQLKEVQDKQQAADRTANRTNVMLERILITREIQEEGDGRGTICLLANGEQIDFTVGPPRV